jgi:hypothetical protein
MHPFGQPPPDSKIVLGEQENVLWHPLKFVLALQKNSV